ncbi:uncharacterized protein A4U43_C01F33990 [Asparagus officinalis]|uniref:SHSP domain-containing protein n=1 Tax=Asparagus officinalis TaxID=4686 RepID=A0A5P1FUI3_ASPOF|nr:inactive protein RESTRICTED TEV MOVEMENT 2-like [Asparagus officinalis]ONK81898.1 uncharacterized protein A4U43_C01F33990 [Asparagus officinalis]
MSTRVTYEDFKPSFKWNHEEGSDTLEISLPGFKKEQIKIQMDNFRNLKVSGERPLIGERWRRFFTNFRIPSNTSNADIRAKFENGTLSMIFPKLFARHPTQNQTTNAQEPASDKKTAIEPKPREDNVQKNQEEKEKIHKAKAGDRGLRFKRHKQLMVNVGVAAVILVAVGFYVSCKLRKLTEADSN